MLLSVKGGWAMDGMSFKEASEDKKKRKVVTSWDYWFGIFQGIKAQQLQAS